jgi:predicted nucleic acid-binding protein
MAESGVFLDTNVVLDHLADRQPFAEYAHRIFALAEMGELKLHLSAPSFCNLYYLLRKPMGHDRALALLGQLRQLTQVTVMGDLKSPPHWPRRERISRTQFNTNQPNRTNPSG